MTDERAVSTTVGFVTTLGVASILISGLLIAGGGFVDDQRERTIRSEMQVIGQQVASDIDATDRLVQTGESVSELRVTHQLPDRVTGAQYSIEVDNSGSQTRLKLSSDDPDVTVWVQFDAQTEVVGERFTGGDLVIRYADADLDGDLELEVTGR
ncbi:DUF7266 family protein [Halomarina rubra]|uniref:Flagellin n=1 Tax=Halomarina rubra TaxID=2071873 RepID=A0ABD6ARG6_9EURY|nr:hypothetical protein [Halomarina rubra]